MFRPLNDLYDRGPLRLVACHSGAADVGDVHGIAQALANKMRQPVMAADDYVTIWTDGSYTIGENAKNTGNWKIFIPQKNERLE